MYVKDKEIKIIEELKEYINLNSDFPATQYVTENGMRLGNIVNSRIYSLKIGSLSDENVLLLKEAGIDWGLKCLIWDEWFQLLTRYFENTRKNYISENVVVDDKYFLGKWAYRQYRSWNKLSSKQQEQLLTLNWDIVAKKKESTKNKVKFEIPECLLCVKGDVTTVQELSTRTKKALKNVKICEIKDLKNYLAEHEISDIRNMGTMSIDELRRVLDLFASRYMSAGLTNEIIQIKELSKSKDENIIDIPEFLLNIYVDLTKDPILAKRTRTALKCAKIKSFRELKEYLEEHDIGEIRNIGTSSIRDIKHMIRMYISFCIITEGVFEKFSINKLLDAYSEQADSLHDKLRRKKNINTYCSLKEECLTTHKRNRQWAVEFQFFWCGAYDNIISILKGQYGIISSRDIKENVMSDEHYERIVERINERFECIAYIGYNWYFHGSLLELFSIPEILLVAFKYEDYLQIKSNFVQNMKRAIAEKINYDMSLKASIQFVGCDSIYTTFISGNSGYLFKVQLHNNLDANVKINKRYVWIEQEKQKKFYDYYLNKYELVNGSYLLPKTSRVVAPIFMETWLDDERIRMGDKLKIDMQIFFCKQNKFPLIYRKYAVYEYDGDWKLIDESDDKMLIEYLNNRKRVICSIEREFIPYKGIQEKYEKKILQVLCKL